MKGLKLYSTTGRKHLYLLNEETDRIMVDAVGREYLKYREIWEKVTKAELEPDFPPQIDFELSTTCNYFCPMCPAELRAPGSKMKCMDYSLYTKVLSDGFKNGLKSVELNYVNEPLMLRDIARFISYAREAGALDVLLNSNGSLLTEEMSEKIISAGLTKLSISLEAVTEATYGKIRYGGNFGKVVNNVLKFIEIRKAMGKRLPLLKLTYLMTKVNVHEFDEYIEYWKDKADLISIQNLTNPLEGERRQKLEDLFAIDGIKLDSDEAFKCVLPLQRMVVRHDGTVLACCHFRGIGLVLGNVKEQNIVDIYHSGFAARIRRLLMAGEYAKIPVCKRCVENSPLANY